MLESFQISCLRQIFGIRWFDFVPNVSVMNQTQQQSIHNRIQDRLISVFVHVRRLQESVPAHEHFVWLSTPVPVTNLMTDRHGNVLEIVPDKPGSASWRSMSGSLQMLLGTWLVIATSGGRNDPSLVKRSSE